ncbi:MAPEG family protein [Terrihabitans rhizophilus]|uniref:MAPEG family protein n=1 Tax=Terrihabitans rhizophilus TaxID=3092662 RepID=A0ABU4RK51_9HYPH|nr:MAPEG family protein [Terrihabitans sp. PJ23]MDX6805229.1 MAPEG family protein [Terrihabitans sp. PJ23]
MTRFDVLLPVFVQAALMFGLLFWLARERYVAVKSGTFDLAGYREGGAGFPRQPTLVNNCYKNQFELPVLFFALVPLAIITEKAGFVFVVLAWVFVVSRIVHALIYTTTNEVRRRALAFCVGVVALFAMWFLFFIDMLVASL